MSHSIFLKDDVLFFPSLSDVLQETNVISKTEKNINRFITALFYLTIKLMVIFVKKDPL